MDGLVQDCSISSLLAIEILQSCTEPHLIKMDINSMWWTVLKKYEYEYDKTWF